MKPDISEFSYGYALTENLIQYLRSLSMPLTAAPIFPSLFKEGQPGGGYDVRFDLPGIPLFLQFKLSDYIWKNDSRIRELQGNLLSLPFFRMHLRPLRYSQQHPMLLSLESQGNLVYYAAPFFYTPRELNQAYLSRQMLQESILIRPSSIGPLPDNDDHRISFNNISFGYFLSNPEKLQFVLLDNFIHDIFDNLEEQRGLPFINNIYNINQQLIDIIKNKRLISDEQLHYYESLEPLKTIASITRYCFDCDLLIIRERT